MRKGEKVRTITAAEFDARCLELMDEVAGSGAILIITKDGRPVSCLVPYREMREAPFGRDRDIIRIHGDIIEPLTGEWEAESNPDRIINPWS